MNGPASASSSGIPQWSGLRQWVELDPANGTEAAAEDVFDDVAAPDAQTAMSETAMSAPTERPVG